jgi:hypothetical protein
MDIYILCGARKSMSNATNLNTSDFSTFCGYLYNDNIPKVRGRDGIPISSFMSDELAFDYSAINVDTGELIIKYGITEIERIPMGKVKSKYAKVHGIK